ncbi:hypothetical protein ACQKP0_09115 [Heyndrickxia sp. NPDC080065]|uniref:hypothetical protein n=1 Tax=Heyndrickxia sp. NPDC080065 TaxID=3390568 RepID=UPI003D06A888
MKGKLLYLLLIVFTFLYIYYPPLFFTNTLHILGGLSWIIIIINRKGCSVFFSRGGYLKEIFFTWFITSYLYLGLLINGRSDLLVSYVFIIIPLEILPICFVIVYLIKKLNGKKTFSALLIHVGFVQGVISVLAFLIPEIQSWVINRMLSYGYDNVIIGLSQHRMFGLSYTFPYSMPIVQGVIACLSIYMGINKNAKYFIFTPFIIFSGIINARISIVIIAIGIVLILLASLKLKLNKKYKIIIAFFAFMILLNPISNIIQKNSSDTFNWLEDGLDQLINLYHGDISGAYTSYITDKSNYNLPDGLKLFFGTSERVIRGSSTYQSDVGYINDIWLGGVFYALTLYSYLLIKLNKIRVSLNRRQIDGTLVSLFLVFVIIFSNFKGTIFGVNEFINLFYLIYIYSICYKDSPSTNLTKI